MAQGLLQRFSILPYETSAGLVHTLPKPTKMQVPGKAKKKKEVMLKSTSYSPKQCSVAQNSFHSPALHSLLAMPALCSLWLSAMRLPCLRSSLSPHHWCFFKGSSNVTSICNIHRHPQEELFSSLESHNNHHTDTLPEFLPISFPHDELYSWYYLDPLVKEGRGQPFQGLLKSSFSRNQCHCYIS